MYTFDFLTEVIFRMITFIYALENDLNPWARIRGMISLYLKEIIICQQIRV